MSTFSKKDLHAVAAPMAKAAHRAVNSYLLGEKFVRTPGFVESHLTNSAPMAEEVTFGDFTLEISACQRPRVVCGVPTPFSLYTFTLCLKKAGKPLAYGGNLSEFLTHAVRAAKKLEA